MFIPGYYEIRRKNATLWIYFHTKNGESQEIWGNSIEDLKRKVEERSLPWNDNEIPKEKPNDVHLNDEDYSHEKYVHRDWWVKSNYKRYSNHNEDHYWDD